MGMMGGDMAAYGAITHYAPGLDPRHPWEFSYPPSAQGVPPLSLESIPPAAGSWSIPTTRRGSIQQRQDSRDCHVKTPLAYRVSVS